MVKLKKKERGTGMNKLQQLRAVSTSCNSSERRFIKKFKYRRKEHQGVAILAEGRLHVEIIADRSSYSVGVALIDVRSINKLQLQPTGASISYSYS